MTCVLLHGLGHLGLGTHDVALDDKLGDLVENRHEFPLLFKYCPYVCFLLAYVIVFSDVCKLVLSAAASPAALC